MKLVKLYLDATREAEVARLRRGLALRAMVLASGQTQREIAEQLGMSQPAISQQLKALGTMDSVHPEVLLDAAAPVLKVVAESHGYANLAVFGSVAKGTSNPDSDIDLIVEAPDGASTFDFIRFRTLLERILEREVDLVTYRGLKPRLDDDIKREAIPL